MTKQQYHTLAKGDTIEHSIKLSDGTEWRNRYTVSFLSPQSETINCAIGYKDSWHIVLNRKDCTKV